MSILNEIVARKRLDLQSVKETYSPSYYEEIEELTPLTPKRSFAEAIKNSLWGSVIAEFKRRSPSRGWINQEAKPEKIVPYYAMYGAAALSILTDTPFFGGTIEDIRKIRPLVDTPILRKDFIIDEHQVYESKAVGADAILLIASCLTTANCHRLSRLARRLELEVLLEIHEERELDCICEATTAVGINNRNLNNFSINLSNSEKLIKSIPKKFIKVSESGITNITDILRLREIGFDAFLIGTAFMTADNPGKACGQMLRKLTNALKKTDKKNVSK